MNETRDTPVAAWMQDLLRSGYSALAAGRNREAADACRRLLGAKPDLVEAHFLVGLVALQTDDTRTALAAFGSVTKLQEDHGAAWAQMARLFLRAGHMNRADEALRRAVSFEDGNPVVQDLIATVYSLLGDQSQAADWIDRALLQQPDRVPFLVNKANNQMFLGKLADAQTTLRRVLAISPENPNAHWLLANVRKASTREHVDVLRSLIERKGQPPQALAFLNYGLGKELEDLLDWDHAFDAFAAGAAARRETLNYDERAEVAMFDELSEVFTGDWLRSRAPGHDDPSPIFIVGQPRTGTTLVERIITSHSEVHSAGELRQFGQCVRRLANYQGAGSESAELVRLAADVDVKALGAAYLFTTQKVRGDRPRFVDKLPPNYRYLPLILAALPNARIIHLRRDPMDACFAAFKQLFADAYPHSYEQREMARHHARYLHLMSVWRNRFPGRYLEVRYEDVVQDLETQARAILEYLELPWEDACLHFHRQSAAVTTASAVQVREPAHTRSIGRWRRYERQLEPMRNSLNDAGVRFE